MTNKLELKSSHEVIDTVDVADVESIFYCKPTDPDILTVLMKDGKRLYCDEVCPLQEEPVSEGLDEAASNYSEEHRIALMDYETGEIEMNKSLDILNAFKAGAEWCKKHQAEKDLELTWEDMMIIHKCIKDAMNKYLYAFQTMEGQQKVYEDVLRRFKEKKGE